MTQNWGDGQPGGYHQYGGLPMAPVDNSRPVVTRPGVAVSAAVLAFVQSGFTAITTLVLLVVAMQKTGTPALMAHGLWILQLIAVVALITGGAVN